MLNQEQIKQLEEALISKKSQLEEYLQELKKELDFGRDIDHLEEETDETEETANYLSLEQKFKERIQNIKKALEKIKNRTYGSCEKCGKEISFEVLQAAPESRLCADCK